MVVMDQFTRGIIGFAVQPGVVDGPALCRMFNQVIAGTATLPQHLSSDHDPLFNNEHRVHASLGGGNPIGKATAGSRSVIDLNDYQWRSHCRGLYQLPAAA